MIATYVSLQNECIYCQSCHGSTAAQHLGGTDADYELIASIKQNYEATEISSNLKALLAITGKVQRGGKQVTNEDIARARQQGATDKETHDTVLIAAAFCMYNRYVDGLATWAPTNPIYMVRTEDGLPTKARRVDRTLNCRSERVCLVLSETSHVVRR